MWLLNSQVLSVAPPLGFIDKIHTIGLVCKVSPKNEVNINPITIRMIKEALASEDTYPTVTGFVRESNQLLSSPPLTNSPVSPPSPLIAAAWSVSEHLITTIIIIIIIILM